MLLNGSGCADRRFLDCFEPEGTVIAYTNGGVRYDELLNELGLVSQNWHSISAAHACTDVPRQLRQILVHFPA
jgi:hypothetical protein